MALGFAVLCTLNYEAARGIGSDDQRPSILLPTNSLAMVISTNTPQPTNKVFSTELASTADPSSTTVAPIDSSVVPPYATNKVPIVVGGADCKTAKPQATAIPSPFPRLKIPNNDVLNIALLGTDAEVDPTDPSFRTDTIVIVSINRTTNTVSLLSIARDLYVCIPSLGMQRVNVAFHWGTAENWKPGGGFGLFQETMLYNFGIPVHYYVKTTFSGFKKVIDTLNGIDLAVDCPIKDQLLYQGNNPQGTPIYAPKSLAVGYQHMDATLALWYVRSRKNLSDFDRNRRQQQMLRTILRAAQEQGLLQKLPELWSQLTSIVDTNLQVTDVLGLIPLGLNISPDLIHSYTMINGIETQQWTTPLNEDVQIPLEPGFSTTLHNFYTPPTKNNLKGEGASVEVFDGSSHHDWDKVAVDALATVGVNAQDKGPTDAVSKTVIYDFTGGGKPSTLEVLLKTLHVRANTVIIQPDPNRTSDFRIVLGANYNSCTAPGFGVVSQ